MKIALVTAGNLWFLPFVRIYTKYLGEKGVDFDIISWNRDGNDKDEGIQYTRKQDLSANFLSKFMAFIRYAAFVKKTIRANKYDKLIIFNPQIAIFLTSVLKDYKGKYIFDYRDLSIDQNRLFSSKFRVVLANSYANIISSPGFRSVLPKDYTYHICHNFDYDQVASAISASINGSWTHESPIKVLTIGGIRDFESNVEVINALANKEDYILKFVGKGVASEHLKEYCITNEVDNVLFTGYYPKEDEPNYILETDFLNIYYPRKKSHDTALSNRFYSSLIFKKPMIVTKHTTQGDFVEQYRLGVALESCENLSQNLKDFLHMSYAEYANRCNQVLKIFIKEQELFRNLLSRFIDTN